MLDACLSFPASHQETSLAPSVGSLELVDPRPPDPTTMAPSLYSRPLRRPRCYTPIVCRGSPVALPLGRQTKSLDSSLFPWCTFWHNPFLSVLLHLVGEARTTATTHVWVPAAPRRWRRMRQQQLLRLSGQSISILPGSCWRVSGMGFWRAHRAPGHLLSVQRPAFQYRPPFHTPGKLVVMGPVLPPSLFSPVRGA